MKDNNIRAEWYKDKRNKVESTFQSGKILHDKRKIYQSESNKYSISITPVVFKKQDRFWAYTLGKIYKGSNHPHESQNPKIIDFVKINKKNQISIN